MRTEGIVFAGAAAYDAVVVGAGLAGLRAAVDLADAGARVALLARGGLASGASFYPFTDGLGCQLPDSDADAEAFLAEVLDTGTGMADEKMYRLQIASVQKETARLDTLGISPYRIQGRAACFAKRERTICAWDDWPAVRARLRDIVAARPGITLWEGADAVQLIQHDGAVCGVWALAADGALRPLYAPAVLLAGGGPCGLFQHSLSGADVTGIAASLALGAGAALVNFEFLQLIPGLMAPKYRWLFCEITLRHCAALTDMAGAPLLDAALPAGVDAAVCLAQRAMHAPFTVQDDSRWFDVAMWQAICRTGSDAGCLVHFAPAVETDENEFVASARALYARGGILLSAAPITLAPFAHSANGGVRIDADGRTGVPGLWCAGEAAGGIHGANRHGGVATAAALVFGARAAADMARYARGTAAPVQKTARDTAALLDAFARPALAGVPSLAQSGTEAAAAPKANEADTAPVVTPQPAFMKAALPVELPTGPLTAAVLRPWLAQLLWRQANVQRTGAGLLAARRALATVAADYRPLADIQNGAQPAAAFSVWHALRTADALLAAMAARAESRGGHCRADAPAADPRFAHRLLVRQGDAGFLCQPEDRHGDTGPYRG